MDKVCELIWQDVEISHAVLDKYGNVVESAVITRELMQVERDCTTDEQAEIDARRADAIANADNVRKAAIQDQIDDLERNALENRGARELHLRLMEQEAVSLASAAGVTTDEYLATVPYYVKLKALDDQITELRAQL